MATEIPTKRRPGRPRKEEVPLPPVTVYQIGFILHSPLESVIEERRYQASSFVLISNLFDTTAYTNEALLRGYKKQYCVEQRFRFLKSPYFVGSLYFQKTERIHSFGWVMLLALMVYSYLQQAIRTALKRKRNPYFYRENSTNRFSRFGVIGIRTHPPGETLDGVYAPFTEQ